MRSPDMSTKGWIGIPRAATIRQEHIVSQQGTLQQIAQQVPGGQRIPSLKELLCVLGYVQQYQRLRQVRYNKRVQDSTREQLEQFASDLKSRGKKRLLTNMELVDAQEEQAPGGWRTVELLIDGKQRGNYRVLHRGSPSSLNRDYFPAQMDSQWFLPKPLTTSNMLPFDLTRMLFDWRVMQPAWRGTRSIAVQYHPEWTSIEAVPLHNAKPLRIYPVRDAAVKTQPTDSLHALLVHEEIATFNSIIATMNLGVSRISGQSTIDQIIAYHPALLQTISAHQSSQDARSILANRLSSYILSNTEYQKDAEAAKHILALLQVTA